MKVFQLSRVFLFILFSCLANEVIAQRERDEFPTLKDFKGLQFKSNDSTIYMNFRFRMQNRLGAYTVDGDNLGIREFDARVRRLRMRVDGYLYQNGCVKLICIQWIFFINLILSLILKGPKNRHIIQKVSEITDCLCPQMRRQKNKKSQ